MIFIDNLLLTQFQSGEYFGAVVCAMDVDRDRYTDLILISAPMFVDTDREGRVYVCSLTNLVNENYQLLPLHGSIYLSTMQTLNLILIFSPECRVSLKYSKSNNTERVRVGQRKVWVFSCCPA